MSDMPVDRFFDAGNWLGRPVNMLSKTAPSPFSAKDLMAVLMLQKKKRIVDMSSSTISRQIGVPVNSVFQVPDNVALFTDSRQTSAELTTKRSGTDVTQSLEADASFSASCMGVTASGSVSYDTTAHFTADQQYAFQSQQISAWSARLADYDTFVNADLLKVAAALPEWDNNNRNTRQEYLNVFEKYGTHTVEATYYGWRYQLQCSYSNQTSDQKRDFAMNVKIAYFGQSADAGYKNGSAYQSFLTDSHVVVSALGGEAHLAGHVENKPSDTSSKQEWISTVGTAPNEAITSINLLPIGMALENMSDDKVRAIGRQLNYGLFDIHSACHRRCTLKMNGIKLSDVSFYISSPNAFPYHPYEGDPLSANNRSTSWIPRHPETGVGLVWNNFARDLPNPHPHPPNLWPEPNPNPNPPVDNDTVIFNIHSDRADTISVWVSTRNPYKGVDDIINVSFQIERITGNGAEDLGTYQVPPKPEPLSPSDEALFGIFQVAMNPERDYWWDSGSF
ncbi:hypothetical protein V1506DRAFT_575018 [Lipomyces tetrasporus]